MTRDELIKFLSDLQEGGIGVQEYVTMQEPSDHGWVDLVDADGSPMIRDVVMFGDARVYIERDDNDLEGVQAFIDFLNSIEDYLPDMIEALKFYWTAKR